MVKSLGNLRIVGLLVPALGLVASTIVLAAPAHAVAAPTGLTPTGPVSSGTPTLSWTKAVGATSYEVQADNASDFSSPNFSVSTTNNRAVPTTNLPNGDVFWRVRSVVSGTTSTWASEQIMIDVSAPPTPISPVGGTEDPLEPNEPALLSWSAVVGAVGYDIEVDVDGDWISPSSYTALGTTFMIPTPQPADVWSWRVRAQRGGGMVTLWSDAATYEVQSLDDVLIGPGSTTGSTIQDVVLDWLPVSGATKYEVQVGLDEDFTMPVETKTVYGTRYSPVTTYDNDQYFWRVRAIDTAGTKMAWPAVPFEFQRDWPDQPALVHPMDQIAPATGDDFYYQWTAVPHATRYKLEIGGDPNFSTALETCTTAATTYTPAELTDCLPAQGSRTYWRVEALDEPGDIEGIYSEIHQFIYNSGAVTLTSPSNFASVGVPTLKWQAATHAERYFVEIRDNTGNVVDTTKTFSLSWTPEDELEPADGPFSWTVQGMDKGASAPTSPQYGGRSFTLTGVLPETGAPVLTPLTGVSGAQSSRFPALTWEPHDDAVQYRIQIGVAGSGFWDSTTASHINNTNYPYPAATDTFDYYLNPGIYIWRVQGVDGDGLSLGYGQTATFEITNLPQVSGQSLALDGQALDAGTVCDASLGPVIVDEDICTGVPATPVLDWNPVPGASHYQVYLANDREMTNRIFTKIETINTRWTPESGSPVEALADNQAGQSYYWFIRVCKSRWCGPDPVATHAAATNAFRKLSPAVSGSTPGVVLVSPPATAPSRANDITFDWDDYYDTNQAAPKYLAGAARSHQTAQKYRIEISQLSTFATLVDSREVDQSTYTPWDGTLPEGALYWRVQAVDAEGNHLNWGPTRQVNKASGSVGLSSPVNNVAAGGFTPFQWQAKDFAASYSIEVYKNDDLTLSTANRVFSATSKQSAYVWTKYLPASAAAYLWRVRWTDGDNHVGAWSAPGRFFVKEGVVPRLSPGTGTYQPAAGPYFTWKPVPSAVKYYVEARKVGTTTSTVKITTVAQAAAASTTFVDGDYEWHVTAYDPSGAVLAQSIWGGFKVDITKPIVVSKTPLGTAPLDANFVGTFNEKVRGVNGSTMRLRVSGSTTPVPVVVTLSVDGKTATMNPNANLVPGKVYTAWFMNGIKDMAGNPLTSLTWKATAQ